MCPVLPNKLFYPFFHHNKYNNKCHTCILIPRIMYYLNNTVMTIKCPNVLSETYLNNNVAIKECLKYIPSAIMAANHDTYMKIIKE